MEGEAQKAEREGVGGKETVKQSLYYKPAIKPDALSCPKKNQTPMTS